MSPSTRKHIERLYRRIEIARDNCRISSSMTLDSINNLENAILELELHLNDNSTGCRNNLD